LILTVPATVLIAWPCTSCLARSFIAILCLPRRELDPLSREIARDFHAEIVEIKAENGPSFPSALLTPRRRQAI
jgi:hypothetical protein